MSLSLGDLQKKRETQCVVRNPSGTESKWTKCRRVVSGKWNRTIDLLLLAKESKRSAGSETWPGGGAEGTFCGLAAARRTRPTT